MRKKGAKGFLLFLFMTMMVGIYAMPVLGASIPNSASQWNGHSYQLYEQAKTWTEAKAYCESRGGHLATITSWEEQNFVESLISKGTKNSYWLGGYGKEANWNWVTGEKFVYSNWGGGRADNYLGQEDRLMIYRYGNPKNTTGSFGKWNDINGNGTCNGESFFGTNNFGFICEWDSGSVSISKASITLSKTQYTYDGNSKTPSVKVVLDGKTLKKGTDYTTTYVGSTGLGTAYVYVKGKGNYTGNVKKTYTIKLAKPTISGSSKKHGQAELTSKMITGAVRYQFVYVDQSTGKSSVKNSETAKVTLTGLSAGKKYTVKVRAYRKLNGKTHYSDYSEKKTIKIYQGKSIKKAKFTFDGSKNMPSYTYTGKAIKPAVKVKYGISSLKQGTDYTVKYSNNINVGTAKLTISGKGKYAGSVTKTFVIRK